MNNSKILLLDAASTSTYYNYCYAESISDKWDNIEFLTTKLPYEDIVIPGNVNINFFFFKISNILNRWVKSQFIRRILRILEYPFNLIALFFKILFEKPKIIHYIWVVNPLIDLFFINLLHILNIKIVYTAHNDFPHELKPWHKWPYVKLYKEVDHIIALTNYVKKTILENTRINPEKITVAPHGDYDCIFSKGHINEKLKKSIFEKTNGFKVISFFGLIRPYKGLEYLIEAFSIAKKKNPYIKLIIFGKSYLNTQRYIERAKELNIEDSIIFDFRYIPLADLMAYLDLTDLAVMPYTHASQSGNIVMFYKKGIPVIVTDVGGLPEMVINGESGYIVPPKNIAKLSDAMESILANDDKYKKMSAFVRELSNDKFSWEKIAEETIYVYQKFI